MTKLIVTLIMLLPLSAAAQGLVNSNSTVITEGLAQYELVRVDEFGQALVKYQKFDDEGNLSQDGFYSDGKPAGVWRMYDSGGNVLSTMKYDNNGNRISLVAENEKRKTRVQYEDDRPNRVVTQIKDN